jgi:putative ABC transport system permease protein
MSIHRWIAKIKGSADRRDSRDRDIREEILAHVQIETDENIARGMSPEDARRAALLRFGNVQNATERAKAEWSIPPFESFLADVRYAGRVLWRAPGFAGVAIVTLGLGIGAITAIFSVAYSVLVSPLPFPQASRLVLLHQFSKAADTSNWRATALDYMDWRDRAKSFSGIAAFTGTGLTISGTDSTEFVLGQRVSWNFFDVLGVQPELGRGFRYEEEEAGHEREIVLSHALWQEVYGGDRSVLGRTITINGQPYAVVGVMPRGFAFPAKEYKAWVPQPFRGSVDPQWVNRSSHFLRVIGRLNPGISQLQADDEIKRIQGDLEQQYPDTDIGEGARVQSLTESVVGDIRPAIRLLVAVSIAVLLIACANVANLLLSRSVSRNREMAIRQAIGAGRARVLRQLLTEAFVLAAAGGILGSGIAWGIVSAVVRYGPRDLPRIADIHLNALSFCFAAVVCLATAILSGLAPFLFLNTKESAENLRNRTSPGGSRLLRTLHGLFASAQIAACTSLLILASLTVRSILNLDAVDPGFNPSHAISFDEVMTEQKFPSGSAMREFSHRALQAYSAIPGVEAAAFTTARPLGGNAWANPVSTPGGSNSPLVGIRLVSPGYFNAMQIPVKRGRSFKESDTAGSEPVAVLTQMSSQKLFPGVDPIGKEIKLGQPDSKDKPRRIVGIVGDIHFSSMDTAPEPVVFLPYDQIGDPLTVMVGRGLDFVLRTSGDPTARIAEIRAAARTVDPATPIHDVVTLQEAISSSVAQPRFRTLLFSSLGVLALILSGIGLYGVLSYAVSQRGQEFGVRIALGATRRDIIQLVISGGLRLVCAGLAVGLGVCILARGSLRALVFGIEPTDPGTWMGSAVMVCVIAALAIIVPTRRAIKADPLACLRSE